MTGKVIFNPGEKFGALTALRINRVEKIITNNPKRFIYRVLIDCQCKCGELVVKDKKQLKADCGCHCGKAECKASRYEN